MKKIRNRLVLFCALIVFLWMLPAQKPMAAALNDEPEQTEDEETVPGETEIAGEPVRALPELADADYVTDVFYTQTTMQVIFSNGELFFYLPKYWI